MNRTPSRMPNGATFSAQPSLIEKACCAPVSLTADLGTCARGDWKVEPGSARD